MDYLQSVLQVQVTEATGQNFGTFATVNGVPLAFNLITTVDLSKGARRGVGQSCLTESNAVYEVWRAAPMLFLVTHRPRLAVHGTLRSGGWRLSHEQGTASWPSIW